ncbi:MAG: hypothetical protein WC650_01630, partial [Candidatus Doudnabacteria bacterium]
FCEAGRRHRRLAAGRSEWIFSGIFDKVGSSEIVNILQDLTFGFLTSHFVGGAQCRPLILGVSAREARGQAEVRNPLRFLYLLCLKKNFCYNIGVLNLCKSSFLMAVSVNSR